MRFVLKLSLLLTNSGQILNSTVLYIFKICTYGQYWTCEGIIFKNRNSNTYTVLVQVQVYECFFKEK
jgi:hypothetical protein